ncbi:MAG: hypothetical protein BMS9Abin31_0431 [Gammaproteobacteria bacterium]|nr:MAG: hypothetical protein BMS9Abin31_0431 [Gammaproteobacteria bacterium]
MDKKPELIRRLSLLLLVFYGIGTILGAEICIEKGFGIKKLSIVAGLMIVAVGVVSVAVLVHGFAGYFKIFLIYLIQ